jgi:hypothetical protein
MSHVEDADAPLSIEILQNKGMRRKAAAAAHDAASLLRTIRKEKEKLSMAFFDDATAILDVLRFLRMFLLMTKQDWATTKEKSVQDLGGFISPIVRGHLLRLLNELIEPMKSTPEVLHTLHSEIVLALYREAVFTWGEAFPFLFNAGEATDVFVELLQDKDKNSSFQDNLVPFESVDNLSKIPTVREHTRKHRLQVLARRFQFGDVLESLVDAPVPWFDGKKDTMKSHSASEEYHMESPRFPATLFTALRKALDESSGYAKDDIEDLYTALCHRVNTKILLFDGLYAITSTETNSISPVLSPTKRALDSTGIYVHANPGPRLLFDATKCAHSIAIVS